jgi:N-acetylmuramoyl-L-alanine amidase
MEDVLNPGMPKPVTKKNKDKVRSAWISFAGRIVAQMVGAIATVGLGLVVLNRYGAPHHQAVPAQPAAYSVGEAGDLSMKSAEPRVTVIVISPGAGAVDRSGNGTSPLPSGELERETEVARAIAKAVSDALPTTH